nr:hypothetical protein [Abalone asfa-like virus]
MAYISTRFDDDTTIDILQPVDYILLNTDFKGLKTDDFCVKFTFKYADNNILERVLVLTSSAPFNLENLDPLSLIVVGNSNIQNIIDHLIKSGFKLIKDEEITKMWEEHDTTGIYSTILKNNQANTKISEYNSILYSFNIFPESEVKRVLFLPIIKSHIDKTEKFGQITSINLGLWF